MEKNPVVENLQRPFDWTGFYIGANIGGVLSEYEFEGRGGDTAGHLYSDVDLGAQLAQRDDLFPDFSGIEIFRFIDRESKQRPNRENFVSSVLGGGQIGYQHQFGHFVVGVEGDFDRASIRDTEGFRVALSEEQGEEIDLVEDGTFDIDAIPSFFGRRTAHTNWMGSARLRVGYATGPLLFYGTGGVAFAGVDVWAHDLVNTFFESELTSDSPGAAPNAPNGFQGEQQFHIVNSTIEKDDDTMVGWTAGGGLEVAFNDAVSLALEYRHTDYGDETFHFNHQGPIFPGATNVNFTNDQVTVRMNVLLNHFFGHGGGMAAAQPATNNVAVQSPFGGSNERVRVGYTKARDADTWSAKDTEITRVEEPFSWTGFYVGANVGGAWADYDFSGFDSRVDVGEQYGEINFGPNATNAPSGKSISVLAPFHTPSIDGGSDDTIIGGGQAGYQHQFGCFVVGVEGDFSGLSTEKNTDFASDSFEFIDEAALAQSNLYTNRKATEDWIASARLKLGCAKGPVMIYLTGGGAWANVRTQATDIAVTDFFVPALASGSTNAPSGDGNQGNFFIRSANNTNDEETVFGWTAGGGAEWAFSKIASLGVEYRHTEFDNADSHYDPHHTPIFANGNHVDIDNDQVTVRVNLLLGHMGPGH